MRDGAEVILFRHGIAESKDKGPDESRRLTAEGTSEVDDVARGMARLLREADALWSSPLVRCIETADRLAAAAEHPLEVRRTDALRPEADPEQFRDLLDALDARHAWFVGHEPNLSDFMRALTRLEGNIELAKAGAYGLRWRKEGAAELEWMMEPRLVRRE